MFIKIIDFPPPPHWLYKVSKRIFRLTYIPVPFVGGQILWSTDGGVNNKGQGHGIPEYCFRKATEEEMKNINIRKYSEDDPYGEEDWD